MRRPRRMVSIHQNTAAPTGDEGLAGTFLRQGVAATQRPISEFGIKERTNHGW